MDKDKSYFPLLILTHGGIYTIIVNTPEEIPTGVSFRVLEVNYKEVDWRETLRKAMEDGI